MKISESRLRKIIQEELLAESKSDESRYEDAQKSIIDANDALKELIFSLNEDGPWLPQEKE